MDNFIISIDLSSATTGKINKKLAIIERASEKATKICIKKIKHFNFGQPVNIVFTYNPDRTIPEDGISGSTIHSGLIYIFINPEKVTENAIYTTVCHELVHAKRFTEFTEIDNRPIAAFVSEGLAVAFEEEIKNKKVNETFFLKTMNSRKKSEKLLGVISKDLDNKDFDWNRHYGGLFFDGNKEKQLPRWAGYEIGYYLVRQYMEKSGKKASELIGQTADTFLI